MGNATVLESSSSCRIGEGKGSWRRTVVAAEGKPDIFRSVPFVLNLSSEQAGDWTVLYQPKSYRIPSPGLMATSEVEALLQLLGSGEHAIPLTSYKLTLAGREWKTGFR
jgi:hypothetical protein